MEKLLPDIPEKRYFTIGEVSDLCGVKPYVLRYWEQEFAQLKPMKRRGNRRYYQHHEVLLIRRIRELLYDEGFTIIGARNRLTDAAAVRAATPIAVSVPTGADALDVDDDGDGDSDSDSANNSTSYRATAGSRSAGAASETAVAHLRTPPSADRTEVRISAATHLDTRQLRAELISIRELLSV